jgi:NAD-dependent deacetylase
MREARPPATMTPATAGREADIPDRNTGRPCSVNPRRAVDTVRARREIHALPMEAFGLEDLAAAAACVARARYAIALTGAGLSVESGIPPFRGPGGLWTRHGEPPMDGYQRFLANPRKAWEERLNPAGPMRELWEALAAAQPNAGHTALVELEERGLLRCIITQNVDNLHRLAGSRRLLEIHGNATLIRCIACIARYPRESIDFAELPPRCPHCQGMLKSDTVSFGEPIPADVLEQCFEEAERADCVIVAGTSATVYPAAQFPIGVRQRGGDLIEVNPYESEITPLCTYALRGPGGDVLPRLVQEIKART